MDGFLLAYKEKGVSSNQVVQKTKRLLSLKKVGHLGTLDPMAEGLLVLAVNRATRFSSFFLESDKRYEAEISFGIKTNTDDAMGEVISESDLIPKESDIKKELKKFLGESLQNPPFFSALKHQGKPLYKYARDGELISKPPRKINIYSIENFIYLHSKCSFSVHCSKGTYIRSIARDLGFKLGCGAHLSGLIRTSQEKFMLSDACSLDEINLAGLISLEKAFEDLDFVQLNERDGAAFLHGRSIEVDFDHTNLLRVYDAANQFIAIGKNSSKGFKHEYLV